MKKMLLVTARLLGCALKTSAHYTGGILTVNDLFKKSPKTLTKS